jgi:hypothetical protein
LAIRSALDCLQDLISPVDAISGAAGDLPQNAEFYRLQCVSLGDFEVDGAARGYTDGDASPY